MLDSVIKKVEQYADNAAMLGKFAFAHKNEVFFEWNYVIDENSEHIIDH